MRREQDLHPHRTKTRTNALLTRGFAQACPLSDLATSECAQATLQPSPDLTHLLLHTPGYSGSPFASAGAVWICERRVRHLRRLIIRCLCTCLVIVDYLPGLFQSRFGTGRLPRSQPAANKSRDARAESTFFARCGTRPCHHCACASVSVAS